MSSDKQKACALRTELQNITLREKEDEKPMTPEERIEKKKKETKEAIAVLFIFVLILAAIISGLTFAVHKFVMPKLAERKNTEQLNTEDAGDAATDEPEQNTVAEADPILEQAKALVSQMTLEQKAAQIFMITPDALTGVTGATAAGETTKNSFQQYPVGGIIYMGANLQGTEQTTTMLANMQGFSQEIIGLPLFLGVDEEGGTVARIASNSAFGVTDVGNMSDIGATGDTQNAYNAGSTISAYLNTLGFNVDFAPVADVWTNAENTSLQPRSFGSDSQLVADMVCAELQGLNEHQVTGVVKHFPGLGGTAGDTHDGTVSTESSLDDLMANDLVPFRQAIANGASMIMVSHLSAPSVTGDDTPSSLSYTMITDVLRGQLGFNGVVITDAMNMGAVTSRYGSADAAVAAVNAGADMILMPDNFTDAYQGVLDAVMNGTIPQDRLDEAVTRIAKLKLTM